MYGQKIKDLRIENNLKQIELAKLLNISQSAIVKYEKEQLQPNIDILNAIADIFNCTVDYILGRESEDGVVVIENLTFFKDNERVLLKSFRKLSKDKQDKVMGYIAALQD
ncbi:MAG: helix-turn-helix transcriptional regulator [Clostridia bacterium]|nr:helix-turn-helix transcriptional regulator [Clostridia bacterium]